MAPQMLRRLLALVCLLMLATLALAQTSTTNTTSTGLSSSSSNSSSSSGSAVYNSSSISSPLALSSSSTTLSSSNSSSAALPIRAPLIDAVRLFRVVVEGGVANFTVEFVPESATDDGGAWVNTFVGTVKACDACAPAVDPQTLIDTISTRYPTFVRFSFVLPVDQVFILSITIANTANLSSAEPFVYTFVNSERMQTTGDQYDVGISAGGVFGIVVGIIVFVALVYGVGKFYQRKGHFRDQVERIALTHPHDSFMPVANSDEDADGDVGDDDEEKDLELGPLDEEEEVDDEQKLPHQ